MSLSFCERDFGTCAGERSGESGLLCGEEISDRIWICSCVPWRESVCEEESDGEAMVTCDPGETGTCLPCVFWAETCLLWAGIWTSSSEETLTSSWAGSVSEAGSSARERGPQSPPGRQSGLRPCASAHSWRPQSFQTRCRRNLY